MLYMHISLGGLFNICENGGGGGCMHPLKNYGGFCVFPLNAFNYITIFSIDFRWQESVCRKPKRRPRCLVCAAPALQTAAQNPQSSQGATLIMKKSLLAVITVSMYNCFFILYETFSITDTVTTWYIFSHCELVNCFIYVLWFNWFNPL